MSLGEEILSKFFNIEHYEIEKIIDDEANNRIILKCCRPGPSYCCKCGLVGGRERYDSSEQEFLIGTLNGKAVYMRTKIYRVNCVRHGITTEDHGISQGKKRHSKAVETIVIKYTEKLDNKAAASLFGVSPATIYRIDFEGLSKLEEQYLKHVPKAKNVSVDEVSYKRRHHYASVISNHEEGKVLWLEKGRKQGDLERGYEQLRAALSDVNCVSMDLWIAFENATKTKLPWAVIVYDRFHIARLINRAIEEERRCYQSELAHDDRKAIKKHSRWVLLKRGDNLSEKNRDHLAELKEANQSLYEIYLLKESFLNIFDLQESIQISRKAIFKWIREVFQTEYYCLQRFARSILKRIRNILSWFDNPISNGKAEGINNVIKTLLKRGYGYKNFDYFRMKVLQKCGYLMNYATHTF